MPRTYVGPEDRVVRLRDGRLMGFAAFGDPKGFPVVNAHGGLAGRLDVMAAMASHAPKLFVRLSARELGASDARVIRSEPTQNFALMSSEALRHRQARVRATG